MKNNLEPPPQRHVRKKLEPRPDRDSQPHLEWIAPGFTAESFWTVTWRWITSLESRARSPLDFAPLDRVRMGV